MKLWRPRGSRSSIARGERLVILPPAHDGVGEHSRTGESSFDRTRGKEVRADGLYKESAAALTQPAVAVAFSLVRRR
jgi:hypothetical protein